MTHPTVIDHQFKVLSVLGEGMSGSVYKVSRGNEIWALKLLKLNQEIKDVETWIEAFKFEFSLLKDISHPHVVKIGDFGLDQKLKSLYFTEEVIEGIPLNEYLKNQPPKVSEDLFIQCLEGLEAIHQSNALHGDIKPSNIYVTKNISGPWIKILDLGIAHPKFHLSAGTPPYFAPERILRDPIDERSDLYSLAVTFYECITGSNPFKKSTVVETLKAHTSILPPEVGSLHPEISPYFNRILNRLLLKNPKLRFRNAAEVLMEFDFERGLESTREIKAPLVTERWVGRPQVLKSILDWASQLEKFEVFFVTGVTGSGKSRALQEVKYELELSGVPIRQLEKPEIEEVDTQGLYLLDSTELNPQTLASLTEKMKESALGLISTIDLEQLPALEAQLKSQKIAYRTQKIPAFTKGDIRELIVLSTHDSNPPEELAEGLFLQTKGNAGQTVHLLTALCQENQLIGSHGEWNLALFREGPLNIASLSGTRALLDDLLQQVGSDEPQKRADLLLQKIEENLRARKREGMDATLTECEELIKKLPNGNERLHLRARMLEKRGWKALQENNLDRAKRDLESAKMLLDEIGVADAILKLRVLNFEAFLAIQSGKLPEAIATFEKTQEQWKSDLAPEEQKKVMNNDLGIALMHHGDYPRAIESFKDNLKFYEGLNDPSYKNRCHYNLGECYLLDGQYQKAMSHYQTAAEGSRINQQWDLLLRAYNGLGNASNKLKNVDASLNQYQRALDLARYLKDYVAAAAVAQNMGVIQKEQGRNDEAFSNLNLSLKLLRQVSEKTPYTAHLHARATLELGQMEREAKNFDSAKELFLEAKRLIQNDKSLEKLSYWILYAQAQLALDQNKPEEFAKLYPDLLHHAKNEEQKKQVEFLKSRSPIDPTLPRFQTSQIKDDDRTQAFDLQSQTQATPPPMPAPQTISVPSLRSIQHVDPLIAILEINQFLSSQRNLDTLFTLVLNYAGSLSGAESGLILLLDKKEELFVAASRNIEVDDNLSQISRQVALKVLSEGKPLSSHNAEEDENFNQFRSVMILGLKSIYCVPIRSQGKVLGVVYLIHRFQEKLFSAETEPVLQAFADQAGIAIENARLLSEIEEQKRIIEEKLVKAEERIETYESILRDKKQSTRYETIVSNSPAMEKIFSMLDRIIPTNLSVLVRGESGTGKELIARALHTQSPRKDKRFVAINCGALPANLIEAELFGYKAGAFTGANRDKKGLFEEADGGTIFLDEIAELDLTLQVKLLRVLQEREITRIGDVRPIPVSVRVVTATHKDLKVLMEEKKFREDLFYRVAEIQVHLPPLRDRREDIPLLAEHFAAQFAKENGRKQAPQFDKKLMHLFLNYTWPGNVRELSNRVRVACALSNGKIITEKDFPEMDLAALKKTTLPASAGSYSIPEESLEPGSIEKDIEILLQHEKTWQEIETILHAKALIYHDFDVIRAASQLEIGQATLYNRMRNEKIKARQSEFEGIALAYTVNLKLEDFKRSVFKKAYELAEEKPYQAARLLGVSPGMFYKWVEGN